jgi:hypothetical protein
MSKCQHVELKKQIAGSFTYYKCLACAQKFKAEVWDGKVKPKLRGGGREPQK